MISPLGNVNRPPLVSLFFLSLLSLSFEILLVRLLSIVQWHHFAYMIISIALLGYGASGAFITLFQHKLKCHLSQIFVANIFLFAFSSVAGFVMLQQLSFNPLELFWDKLQWIWLLKLYVLLMLPFFFVAFCIGSVLFLYREKIDVCYGADLFGAALGALGIVFLLHWFSPVITFQIIIVLIGLTGIIAIFELRLNKSAIILCIMIMLIPWLLPKTWLELNPSEYKSLSQTLNIIGTRVVHKNSSPLGVITVVESPVIPFHHAPGLSLNSSSLPPEQLGVFLDGDSMSVITRFDGDLKSLDYLNNMTSALPYTLLDNPEVLILGAGGGTDVLQAKYFEAKYIDAVELNSQVVDLLNTKYAEFSGNIYTDSEVNIHIAEARAYLQTSDKKYDLIQLALMDSFATSAAGLHALNESYLYTTEAMKLYLKHLKPDGILAFTRWVKLPPRDTLKLVATAKEALLQSGVADPQQHIALIRSWNTTTLIIKNAPLSALDITNITDFSHLRSFDLVYYPEITAAEVNQFNVLPTAYFFQGTTALLSSDSRQFVDRYKYKLQASTDDKPYFFHFLKWRSLPEIFQLPAKQGIALIEWGTIILLVTLIQASLVARLDQSCPVDEIRIPPANACGYGSRK